MMRLDRESEQFSKTGNIAAEGFRKLMGMPALGIIQTLVREAIQNSVDATAQGRSPGVQIRIRTLEPTQASTMRDVVFGELPRDSSAAEPLSRYLASPELRVLEVNDYGTVGLAGPTRADIPALPGEPPNFVNFLRNVGAGRDIAKGGGTYGYGKSAFYLASECNTVLVDTLTLWEGKLERRIMGCHLGCAFDGQGDLGRGVRRYTGRHWWGIRDETGHVDPVRGGEAEELADLLGLPERSPDRFGTSVMILGPRLSSQAAREELVEAVLWNFWPRMTRDTQRDRRLAVRVEVDGDQLSIPSPEDYPPLDLFSAALKDVRAGGEGSEVIRCGRPKQDLGRLAIRHGLRGERHSARSGSDTKVPDQSRHIALMRPVELVVRYLEGEPFADQRFEWAGVFVCSDEDAVEEAFAASEPPAHDDWVPDNLEGHAKRFVNVALRELRKQARGFVGALTPASGSPGASGPSLGRTAVTLGRLLTGAIAPGPGRQAGRRTTPSSGPRRTRVSSVRFDRLERMGEDGRPIAVFMAEVDNEGIDPSLTLIVEPRLVTEQGDTGPEDLPGSFLPKVVSVRFVRRPMTTGGPALHVGTESGAVEIRVATTPHAVTGIRARLQGEGHE